MHSTNHNARLTFPSQGPHVAEGVTCRRWRELASRRLDATDVPVTGANGVGRSGGDDRAVADSQGGDDVPPQHIAKALRLFSSVVLRPSWLLPVVYSNRHGANARMRRARSTSMRKPHVANRRQPAAADWQRRRARAASDRRLRSTCHTHHAPSAAHVGNDAARASRCARDACAATSARAAHPQRASRPSSPDERLVSTGLRRAVTRARAYLYLYL
jgi:hypothetical protein